MKTLSHLATLLLSTEMALAQADPLAPAVPRTPDEKAPNVRIDVQMVAIPRQLALPLISELAVDDKAEGAFSKIQELIGAGTAQLIGWPLAITRSGQRAQVENIHEVRYGTEFQPGGVSIHLIDKEGTLSKVPTEIEGVEAPSTATAFETRNTGATLEVEPVLSPDRKTIDLNLVPQHVRLRGMRKTTIEHSKNGKTTVEQPDFDTMRTQTQLTVRNGQRVLLGVFPTDDPPDHIELFLLKAETREP